ncbi:MAG: VOC family protein [Pseudomonadota bacterium]
MAAPSLEYVALAVEDVGRASAFFSTALGLPQSEHCIDSRSIHMIEVGESALALFDVNDPFLGPHARKGVNHVALGATSPLEAARAAGFDDLDAADLTAGIDGRSCISLPKRRTCGVDTRFIEPLRLSTAASSMVERIDHIGIASADNQAAKSVFLDQLGCVYESEQTDSEFETRVENFVSTKYPNVFHSRPSQLRGSLRVTFITTGDCELEFLQDLTAEVQADQARHDAAGNTRGDRSAIARYVERTGGGLHHLAFKTENIDAVLRELGQRHRIIDAVGRPGSRRARIGFVHPGATGGVLVHFVEREEVD